MHPHSPITEHARLIPPQRIALKKLGLETLRDLLYHFPSRYGDTSETRNISSLAKGDTAVVFGKISKLKTSKGFKTKIAMADAWVEDESGKIHCVWFNQPYLAKMTPEDAMVRIEGKVSERKKTEELYFSNPKLEVVNKLPTGVGDSLFGDDGKAHTLYPVYPESRGITSNWIYHKIIDIFKNGLLDTLVDPIPDEILKKYSLPSLKTALIWIHTPMRPEDAESARKRFAFEEVFFIQLEKQIARKEYEKNPAFIIDVEKDKLKNGKNGLEEFIKRFPFEATEAQTKSINIIIEDFKKGHAMSRLLEGDVGSGKTAVAAATAYAIVTTTPQTNGIKQKYGNLEVAYMCPTEILAVQHFESFIKYFAYLGIQIGLITGSGCRKFPSKLNPKGWTDISRTQLLKWVANGEIPILIGTHALIQKSVKFKNLAYVIIDEQHRFGLKQRASLVQKELLGLAKKTAVGDISQRDGARIAQSEHALTRIDDSSTSSRVPHLLSMTATPIPRTLALTIYGDLDLTLLDQMPHGRKPIITEIVSPNHRIETYEKIRKELETGRQVYIICPRIDEPDPDKEMAINAKSVKEEAKRLKAKIFPEYEIGILHSKMKPSEKEKVMLDFKNSKIHILVATSVVEVGVNVENATVIVIEGAERFGLAQLHQLRGRVIRSNHQAYCYVFADTKSEKTFDRLNALKTAKNGFELAEYDLKFRGGGELSGGKQWGVSDIAMEALKNIKMVEAARAEAQALISEDLSLTKFPQIKNYLKERKSDAVHWE
jgi:ATP-dependent DNA helicase RecG